MNRTVAGSTIPLFGDVTPRSTDEWYTPRWIFDACGVVFDMDVCAPIDPESRTVPAREYLTAADDGLTAEWTGYVWMNPPYSGSTPWVHRWAAHRNGLALLPALKHVHWLATLLATADAVALLNVDSFRRPNGKGDLPCLFVLAGAGDGAARNVARVAAADKYHGGAYHVRPES